MDFIGTVPGGSGRIPVPNLGLTPEMLCKNYPFEFLMQPIIPLLSPATSEKASFCLSFPALKEACIGLSKSFSKLNFQIVGIGIVATCVSYGVWKISLKLSDGIFGKDSSADTDAEILDEEVARILSTIREESTLSTSASCSQLISGDVFQHISTTSSVTDRFSQDTIYSFTSDAGKPLKQLQSRIDQVMSKVEVVISSLKVLEDNMASPKKNVEKSPDKVDKKEEEVATTEERKENVFEVFSTREKQLNKEGYATIHPYSTFPNFHFDLEDKRKPYQYGLETGDKEENLEDIHQRIKDLEKRIENMNHISRDKKISPCESTESSFCSDRWDKSSSVSIISEHNQEFGNNATSPLALPITIQSLMSPSHHSRALTPPSDRRTRSYNAYKNLKRNARSRPSNFTQFPTIEEVPHYFPEHIDNFKADTLHKNFSPASASASAFHTTNSGGLNVSRQWYSDGDMKRQGSWPCHDFQHNDTSEAYFCIPKINTFKSQFKQSENSCFKAMKSEESKSERAYCYDIDKAEMSRSAPQKSQNTPRHGVFNKEMFQLKSSNFSFESSRPAESNHNLVNTSPKAVIKSRTTECTTERISESPIKKSNSKRSCSQNNCLTTAETNELSDWKAPKHKLVTCEVDAPPRKLSRGNIEASASSQCANVSSKVSSDAIHETTHGGKSAATPTHKPDRLRRMSPFKKFNKSSKDYQVKYISKKAGEETGKATTVSQNDKEEEWIVILPNDRPCESSNEKKL